MTVPVRPKLRQDLIVRQVEEDFVVYDPVTDRTALLNISAAAVLDLCDGTRTSDEIAVEVAALFSAPKDSILGDVETSLRGFGAHGLLCPETGE